mgnify:CR=1 FL=1
MRMLFDLIEDAAVAIAGWIFDRMFAFSDEAIWLDFDDEEV